MGIELVDEGGDEQPPFDGVFLVFLPFGGRHIGRVVVLHDEIAVVPEMDKDGVVPIKRLEIRSGFPFIRHFGHQIVGQNGLGKRDVEIDAFDLRPLLTGHGGQRSHKDDAHEQQLSVHR